ncbi:TAXI family TRAP transporter solute-binding subunit [Fodinicurvata fenggangensis]|uniref:TAXI family TRAP transporter solute-binding subunit n=1 Tax=Fodinicurvata fenggangensis TaxID=1121830 RepID=UPI00047A358F|nr:TAXI family TRAP transporter solute-binding subunit [Fodinicurvata fenggangensis]
MIDKNDATVGRRTALRFAAGGAAGLASVLTLPQGTVAKELAPSVLHWGSSSLGSTGYVIIEALASTVNDKTNLRNSSMSTSGGAENMALIGEGAIHLGQTTSSDWPAAIKGEEPYNKPIKCHQMFAYTMWNMPPLVRADSNIESFADLQGKRIMPSNPTSSAGAMWKVVFKAAGMDEDVDWNYGSWRETYNALKTGKVDAIPALVTNGRPSPILTELLVSQKVRAIEVPKDIMDKARTLNPGVLSESVSSAAWDGDGQTIKSPTISGVVGAHPDLDPEICYKVTKAIFENEAEIRKIGVQLQDIKLQFAVDYLLTEYPVNPGAAQYFKEKGVWRDELKVAS